jgi:hypothetical protein
VVQLDHLDTRNDCELSGAVVSGTYVVVGQFQRSVFQRIDDHRVRVGLLAEFQQ